MLAMVGEPLGLSGLDLAAEPAEPRDEVFQRRGDLAIDGHPVDGGQDRDPEVRQALAPCRRDREPPRDVLTGLGTRRDVQRQLEIVGGAGERPLDAHHDRGVRHRGHRELSAPRHRRFARAVAVDAAEGGGHSDRAADVAAELERGEAGGERRRAAAGRAARSARQVPRIVRPPVDRIARLPVRQHLGHVRLRHHDGARALHAGGHRRVVLRTEVLPHGHPGRGPQAADVDGLLQRHRQAAKRRVLTARPSRVGGFGLAARALEVELDDRVQLGVVTRDALQVQLEQLDGGHPARAKRGEHVDSGRERVDGVAHGVIPLRLNGELTLAPPPGTVKARRGRGGFGERLLLDGGGERPGHNVRNWRRTPRRSRGRSAPCRPCRDRHPAR